MRWNPYQDKALRALWKHGHTYAVIARVLEVSRGQVASRCSKLKLSRNDPRGKNAKNRNFPLPSSASLKSTADSSLPDASR